MSIVLYVVNRENIGRDPSETGVALATVIEFSDVYKVEAMRSDLREWCNLMRVPYESVALVTKSGSMVDLSDDTD